MELSAYARLSQDKTGAGIGVENQLDAIRQWAESNGHTITATYSDNDLSATSGKRRPGFEALLASGDKAVVVWHQDRLLRLIKDLERVIDAGIMVYQVNAGTLDLTTPQGRAIARTVAAMATAEVEQKAERQKLRNAADAKAGKHYWRAGIRPFGWTMDGKLHPEESEALRAVYRGLMEDGWTVARAVTYLNDAGLTPERGGKRGQAWHHSSLTRILTSPRLKAVRVYKGEEFAGAWEALLTEDEFNDLQGALKFRDTPRRRHGRENLLSSIAVCGTCGGSMGQSRSNQNVASYRCSALKHNSKTADLTDALVVGRILPLLSVPNVEDLVSPSEGVTTAELRRQRLAELERWEKWQTEAAEAELSPKDYVAPRKKHEAKLSEIDSEILRRERDSIFAGMFSVGQFHDPVRSVVLPEVWEGLDIDRKRALVRLVFSEVRLLPGKRGAAFDPQTVKLTLSDTGRKLWDAWVADHEASKGQTTSMDEWLASR